MSVTVNIVRAGVFLDSVVLMQISRELTAIQGVEDAALMMATPANWDILSDADLLDEDTMAGPGDLLVAVRAQDQAIADSTLQRAAELMERPAQQNNTPQELRPLTLRSACRQLPDANLALISVPGDFAGAEARKALRAGLNVMIFSDNVSLAEEISLKREARDLGLIVMGPDCGTAIIDGVPLAFANVVPRGDIAIVGASGTGIQEVSCLIAHAGEGISHAIGVGGRDLTEAVGAISTLTVLDWLERDVATHHIVLISKPPAPSVVDQITEFIRRSSKSYTVCLVGSDDLALPDNAKLTTTLKDAAAAAVKNSKGLEALPAVQQAPAAGSYVRGLYSGGTLAAEAQVVFLSHRQPVLSNVPVPGAGLFTSERTNHIMIDLGDDRFTRGRPHPMIDPAVRDEPICVALSDPDVGAVLLDVVIGFGAHPDPAGHLAGLLDRHGRSGSVVIASVTGTDEDPQVRAKQVSVLERAGVVVAPSNADAAELALACLKIG